MRSGVTQWQAGSIEVAHGMICKAYAILMVTHGPTHPITKDLEVNMSSLLYTVPYNTYICMNSYKSVAQTWIKI